MTKITHIDGSAANDETNNVVVRWFPEVTEDGPWIQADNGPGTTRKNICRIYHSGIYLNLSAVIGGLPFDGDGRIKIIT